MARFYASFDNSTISSIEALTTNNYYQRLNMTNGTTIKSALVSARDALSTAMYAQLTTVNKNGLLGVTVPTDGYAISGGNFFGSPTNTVYTNTNAVWQSDPRAVRTTTPTVTNITVANSTAVSPLDPYSFSSTLYTDATTAVQNMLSAISPPSGFTGNGPYARIGINSFRTLASIWTDHALTFVAWDDYTPGQPATLSPSSPVDQPAANDLIITVNWSIQYSADRAGTAGLYFSLHDIGVQPPGGDYTILSTDVSATNLSYVWTIPGGTLPPGAYELDLSVTYKDPTIAGHEGTPKTYGSGGTTPFITLT